MNAPVPRREPIAIIDIGSNSVRLVAYEGLTRAPIPIFNEKVLCGLGKGVSTSGRLNQDGIDRALAALRRFRVLCRNMGVADLCVMATAAARDASNGAAFLDAARTAIGCGIELLSGDREAELAALGVVSSIHAADGVAGDLGGGSLELSDVKAASISRRVSLPIGGLALSDKSGRSPKKAARIVRDALAGCGTLDHLAGRSFYAIGGTWRSLARVHMQYVGYPLHVMHAYTIAGDDALAFARLLQENHAAALAAAATVSPARAPLLAYGAVVLEQIIRRGGPREIVVSALGVREGMLYERLSATVRQSDPLIAAAREINAVVSRSPQHGEDLIAWTDGLYAHVVAPASGQAGDQAGDQAHGQSHGQAHGQSHGQAHAQESSEERRLRHAVCLLADVSWRAHPDYRSAQSVSLISHAVFIGIDHAGRGFLALAIAYRHLSPDEDVDAPLKAMLTPQAIQRARLLGAALRVAYVLSAAMPGVLPRTSCSVANDRLQLTLSRDLGDLASEKLMSRLKQFGRLVDRDVGVAIDP